MKLHGRFADHVSKEPLDVIEALECFREMPSVTAMRFRRLFNELEQLRKEKESAFADGAEAVLTESKP